ncbi:hypothetical protein C8R47DRAFT_654727 [Mycena vitilis]|nr:hypothetical protein C8R47DRAFT_654727 [Mycena vitilis]
MSAKPCRALSAAAFCPRWVFCSTLRTLVSPTAARTSRCPAFIAHCALPTRASPPLLSYSFLIHRPPCRATRAGPTRIEWGCRICRRCRHHSKFRPIHLSSSPAITMHTYALPTCTCTFTFSSPPSDIARSRQRRICARTPSPARGVRCEDGAAAEWP